MSWNTNAQHTRRGFLRTAVALPVLGKLAGGVAEAESGSSPASAAREGRGFRALRLRTHRLDEQRRFYNEVLGLPLKEEAADSFTVVTPGTELTFSRAGAGQGRLFYHFAFDIPGDRLEPARRWLNTSAPPVRAGGRDVLHVPSWDADSIYFHDAEDNLLEFLARRNDAAPAAGSFSPRDILCVSELAIAGKDMEATAADLEADLGLARRPPGLERGLAVGDAHRTLLLIEEGSVWSPVPAPEALASPVVATLMGGDEGVLFTIATVDHEPLS